LKLWEHIWGSRAAPGAPPTPRALIVLQSYGLPGYARLGNDGDDFRAWAYDGDDLANGGLPAWITKMSVYLNSQEVVLSAVEHVPSAEGCRIAVNGKRYLVCGHRTYVDSQTAIVSSVQIVNDLLELVGSEERGYVLSMGNDSGLALFMTPRVFARLASDVRLRPKQRPIDVGTYTNPIHEALPK
jgi:hypothetical protein